MTADVKTTVLETLAAPTNLRVEGGQPLSGSIRVHTSKNGTMAVLCASLLNKGRTELRDVAGIQEVHRIVEVLTSIGVCCEWGDDGELVIVRPERLDLDNLDSGAAQMTRSILLMLGPLVHEGVDFRLPHAGGCELGARTVEPHLMVLGEFGLKVTTTADHYEVDVAAIRPGDSTIILTERGDTATENALLAASRRASVTVIRNASANYMVQELCFFLQLLGVEIEGIGTSTLRVVGCTDIDVDVTYSLAEDPVEAMTFLTAAIATASPITIERAPIEFLEVELAHLATMGFDCQMSAEYTATNGRTRLVDITAFPSELTAAIDKIHPMPFPGINIDNLPFFVLIGAVANGETLIHDWVYENRMIYLTELARLGSNVRLLDPHRLVVRGPTKWRPNELMCPPALRPAVVVLLAMLAAPGSSVLRNIYIIERGHQDLAQRLCTLNAGISIVTPD